MDRQISGRQKVAVVLGTVGVIAAGGVGVAMAAADDDTADRPIEGSALERASEAALAETGGGEVTATEVGDEESMYEVEVTRADGSQVDVQLDEHFRVVGSETDGQDEEQGGNG